MSRSGDHLPRCLCAGAVRRPAPAGPRDWRHGGGRNADGCSSAPICPGPNRAAPYVSCHGSRARPPRRHASGETTAADAPREHRARRRTAPRKRHPRRRRTAHSRAAPRSTYPQIAERTAASRRPHALLSALAWLRAGGGDGAGPGAAVQARPRGGGAAAVFGAGDVTGPLAHQLTR